jgi:UDP-glucose 4-epimerase
MTTVLVTGGAGYVGSHTCLALAEAGFTPVVYDNLCNGHAAFVQWGPLEKGDIRDGGRLDAVIAAHRPAAVIHFAAFAEIAESIAHPGRYYDNNVGGSIALIEAARRAGIDKLVFSSSCATYGQPVRIPIDEDHPQVPLNPYGRSKLMVEQALADYAAFAGLRSVSLRYFNAAGAEVGGRIGERHQRETRAIPLAILSAMGARPAFTIFGDDYETPDGTAIRDYTHVDDLAAAHVRALTYLLDGGQTCSLNLGTGIGTSLRQMIAAIDRITGRSVPVTIAPRRVGEASAAVADVGRAQTLLGWRAKRTLDDIVQTAWRWHATEQARLTSFGEDT